jgi:hypothetical protein
MAHPARSVVRAVQGGLVLGLFGASLIFLWGCWQNAHKDCEFPGTEECMFELTTAQEIARLQAFAAIGCATLAAGGYLLLRRT